MDTQQQTEMAHLKGEIAALYAQREQLKQAVSTASRAQRQDLWTQLEALDRHLSVLDSRYKVLWDAQ